MLGEPHLRENVFMAYLDQATLRLPTAGENFDENRGSRYKNDKNGEEMGRTFILNHF